MGELKPRGKSAKIGPAKSENGPELGPFAKRAQAGTPQPVEGPSDLFSDTMRRVLGRRGDEGVAKLQELLAGYTALQAEPDNPERQRSYLRIIAKVMRGDPTIALALFSAGIAAIAAFRDRDEL